jgi:hypothetical protein
MIYEPQMGHYLLCSFGLYLAAENYNFIHLIEELLGYWLVLVRCLSYFEIV